ncbi:hypothetical protein OH77DRAFT_1316748 [Trametes cingulata]|nr:hypothetical protein OH77DRAFT_1316748 [Trametes cingulata]
MCLYQTRRTELSFKTKHTFLKTVDRLPEGTTWLCERFEAVGDEVDEDGQPRVETLELWRRDPVDCIRELLGNPAFREMMRYAPEKLYADPQGQERMYGEMWTGDWWWRLQSMLPEGATIAPVILASDKTTLSRFSGDKSAWPVYLSIGNIEKATRRKPSMRATVLLGYIPVSKLECFSQKSRRKVEGFRLYHECMRALLEPLIKAGRDGVEMVCADGRLRRIYPILAAYIADHPEQCLVTCCQENFCPKCPVSPNERGEPKEGPLKKADDVDAVLRAAVEGERREEFEALGLRPVQPFWCDLPHSDIFSCITPDILHQLHKGVFKDHLVSWATKCADKGSTEIDRRFRTMTRHPELRHFKKGISLVSQWTGTEYKNMEKVFLSVIAGSTDAAVVRPVRAILDFIYYAHFELHTDNSLAKMKQAWLDFHHSKDIFVVRGIRSDFNIPKVHSMEHYVASIRLLGTADGYSTEGPERLHIDFAKHAYDASNKQLSYTEQMTVWLNRQDAVFRFDAYLAWSGLMPEPSSTDDSEPLHDARLSGEQPLPCVSESARTQDVEGTKSSRAPVRRDEGSRDGAQLASQASSAVAAPGKKLKKIERYGYAIADKPARAREAVAFLFQHHGATDFAWCLNDYLLRLATSHTTDPAAASLARNRHLPIHDLTRLPVFHRFDILLPRVRQVTTLPILDTVHASPARPAQGTKPAVPARFSTVLVDEPHALGGQRTRFSAEEPLKNLRIAQVRAIFQLPASHRNTGTPSDEPLAYVEWFTRLQVYDQTVGMYSVARSTRQSRRNASIIPITAIVRTCHLVPIFGQAVDTRWTPETALESAPRFFVNPYVRHHDFVLFRLLGNASEARTARSS